MSHDKTYHLPQEKQAQKRDVQPRVLGRREFGFPSACQGPQHEKTAEQHKDQFAHKLCWRHVLPVRDEIQPFTSLEDVGDRVHAKLRVCARVEGSERPVSLDRDGTVRRSVLVGGQRGGGSRESTNLDREGEERIR